MIFYLLAAKAIFGRYLDDGQKYWPNIALQILPLFCSKTGLRLIILSRGLERSFGNKLAVTLSHNFVSMCNFMTVNDFYIRYGTLPHTFSHFCHTLGKLHTLWEVWESVRKLHQICVLKNQAKNQFEKFENNRMKKIHFFEKFSFPATPRNSAERIFCSQDRICFQDRFQHLKSSPG